jgi:hypothetical protein
MTGTGARPAFYALSPGGWRDYVTLLHVPYTLWHLSYVVVGATLAPEPDARRLAWTLAAFALAMGVGAHALDELNGRPLGTRIPQGTLVALSAASVAAAVAIGIGAALAWTLWLLPFVAAGAFLVVAYNLELFGGRVHGDIQFALAWGAFPVLTAYLATAETIRVEAVLAAVAAMLLSLAQRRLSAEVRYLRRRVVAVSGTLTDDTGEIALTRERLIEAPERALRLLSAAVVALALALAAARLA